MHIKFNVLDTRYCGLIGEASGYIKGLLAAADKTTLKFREVVVCRAVVLLKDDGFIRHEQYMWSHPGPFTSEQLLKIIQYKSEISSNDWCKHMIEIDKTLVSKL